MSSPSRGFYQYEDLVASCLSRRPGLRLHFRLRFCAHAVDGMWNLFDFVPWHMKHGDSLLPAFLPDVWFKTLDSRCCVGPQWSTSIQLAAKVIVCAGVFDRWIFPALNAHIGVKSQARCAAATARLSRPDLILAKTYWLACPFRCPARLSKSLHPANCLQAGFWLPVLRGIRVLRRDSALAVWSQRSTGQLPGSSAW